jgi:hypothetical protein
MKRRKMSRRVSKKVFKKNTGVQRINRLSHHSMRGGIRL